MAIVAAALERAVSSTDGGDIARAEGRTFDLTVGRVVALDRGIVHEIEAVEESAVLQTIAWPTLNENPAISPPM